MIAGVEIEMFVKPPFQIWCYFEEDRLSDRRPKLAGQEAKARRGELFKRLPVGYARDPAGKIMFHPENYQN
jgi:hypothetical protein